MWISFLTFSVHLTDPLVPYVKRSSRSDSMSLTRKLPGLSTFKVMPSSTNFVVKTSTPIHNSETSSFLSKQSTSLKTTAFVKSTQRPSKAVTAWPSTPIFQTSVTNSQTTRPLKTTRTSYLTITPSESTVNLKTQGSSFAVKFSSSYRNYNMQSSNDIRSSIVVGLFIFSHLPVSSKF